MTPDPEAVAALLRRAASEIILPRFKKLDRHHIREKGPGDLVTIADTESEAMLTPALRQLAPGSVVVGEEAVAADGGIIDRLAGAEAVWLIDPVDGTHNFAHGSPEFAIIVAFVERGAVRAGWIHEPVEGETVWAVEGDGTWRGSRRLRMPAAPPIGEMTGMVAGRLLNGERARDALEARMGGKFVNIRCAGRTYIGLAEGRFHYAYFSRSKPWDHAAGWLIHREAGGHGAFIDGEAYTPVRPNYPIALAPDRACWKHLQSLMV